MTIGAPSQPLADEDARRRIRAGGEEETLFVNAGAGSGKTTELVNRIVGKVLAGVPVERIAAITFTEAAAAELRERVRTAIGDAVRGADAGSDEIELLNAALDHLDAAAIQTLHAFALDLLRRFPIEAGLPPAIDVADDVTAHLRFEERREALLDELYGDPHWVPYLEALFEVGRSDDDLLAVAAVIDDNYDRLPEPLLDVPPPRLDPVEVDDLVARYLALLGRGNECTDAGDKLLGYLDDRVGPHVRGLASQDAPTVMSCLSAAPGPGNGGRAASWPPGAKEEIRTELSALKQECEQRRARRASQVLDAFVNRLGVAALRAATDRHASGALSFHDLLVKARSLLRNAPQVRAELHATWDFLLVDEFQDTDPLQIEIVTLIAAADNDRDPGGMPWDEVPTVPGRLFFVGDPKQSIYRFRRADIELYRRVEHLRADGVVTLSTNFRSAPGIVNWVNGVFGALMKEGPGSPPYEPLVAHREPPDGRPSVHVLGDGDDARVGELREASATELVGLFSTMLSEAWPVLDPATGHQRPVELSDITVLVPTRLAVQSLERALESAGMPYVLATRSLVWERQEIREVLGVLRALADDLDQVSLLAALRTPWLGCSDRDLVDWVAAGGRWRIAETDGERADLPVARALSTLASLRDRIDVSSVDSTLRLVMAEMRAVETGLLDRDGRERWRRLLLLADQAQLFVEQGGVELKGFLDWIDLQSSDVVTKAQVLTPEPDNPAVRIMTIHGAKGLEFPVCALFGLTTSFRDRPGPRVVWASDPGLGAVLPAVRLGSGAGTSDYDVRVPLEDQLDVEERVRLLYVGATRARDHLVVCAHHRQAKTAPPIERASFGQLILDHLPEEGEGEWWERRVVAPPTGPPTERPAPVGAAEPGQHRSSDPAEELAGFERSLVARGPDAPSVVSATSIATGVADESLEPGEEGVRRGRGSVGAAIGRAVHATMQVLDATRLDDTTGLVALAGAQAAAEGLHGEEAATVAATVAAMVDHPVVRGVLSGRHWREPYVAAPVGGVVVEGYVDLLGDDGNGGLVVLDYKSDFVDSDAAVAEKVERYRLQIGAYAAVLHASTGLEVSAGGLVFVREGVAEVRWIDDLPAAVADVEAAVTAPASP